MRKLFLVMCSVVFAFPALAQFIDVEKIGAPAASHSIMFQSNEQQEQEAVPVKKQKIQPQRKPRVLPTKSAEPLNVRLFKSGEDRKSVV